MLEFGEEKWVRRCVEVRGEVQESGIVGVGRPCQLCYNVGQSPVGQRCLVGHI